MRSNLMTLAMVAVSVVLVAPMAGADESVQKQLRLMEQRMAEMEDRLEATSEELRTAKSTVDQQQEMLSGAGLVDSDDRGARSGVGSFLELVDISGVAAASFNYRFIDKGDNDGGNTIVNDTLFRHPNADSFQFDQLWMVIDKAPTEESRGGFHAEIVYGETAQSQGGENNVDSGLLYTGYASYLAPIGNGVQIDAGKLATPLGGEVIQTNQNFNITTGSVFGLQPVTHVGISAATQVTDGFGFIVGVTNEVYDDSNISFDRDKAYYGQAQFGGDRWGLNVGAIVGEDPGAANCNGTGSDCNTSVFDVYASIDPTDNFSAWVNFDWVRNFGDDVAGEGDAFGAAAAARLAVTDATGIAGRFEYLFFEDVFNGTADDSEFITVTGTVDHALTDNLKVRGEVRWDHNLEDSIPIFSSGEDDQLVGLLEMYYEF